MKGPRPELTLSSSLRSRPALPFDKLRNRAVEGVNSAQEAQNDKIVETVERLHNSTAPRRYRRGAADLEQERELRVETRVDCAEYLADLPAEQGQNTDNNNGDEYQDQ